MAAVGEVLASAELAAVELAAADLLDALAAVREAVGIPHGAKVGDYEVRDAILVERRSRRGDAERHLRAPGTGRDPMITWSAEYPRGRLAEGYRAWHECVAELGVGEAAAVW